MAPAPLPRFESRRQRAVDALDLPEQTGDGRLGCLVRLAQRWFGVQACAVSLSDGERQRFVARSGCEFVELPRELSLCAHAVTLRQPLVVPDTTRDPRFSDNPFVLGAPRLRFYAGVPLFSLDGQVLGTLCLLDDRPRSFGDADLQVLQDHAQLCEGELDACASGRVHEPGGVLAARDFHLAATPQIEQARRTGNAVTVALFDLVGMRRINADFGHGAGDRAIDDFAQALLQCFAAADTLLGRLRGDRFAALLRGADPAMSAERLRRLAAAVDRLNESPRQCYDLRYALGLGRVLPHEGGALLRRALGRADDQLCARKFRPLPQGRGADPSAAFIFAEMPSTAWPPPIRSAHRAPAGNARPVGG